MFILPLYNILSMKNILLSFLFAVVIGSSVAQKLEVVEGDLSELSGLDKIHFEFTYDDLVIGESKPEPEFVAEKRKAWDEREQGKGAEWEDHWITSRSKLYEPAFINAFTERSAISADNNAKYIFVFKAYRLEPGWNGGPVGVSAYVNAEVLILTNDANRTLVAKLTVPKYVGNKYGGDFEIGQRIAKAYGRAGEALGSYFKRTVIGKAKKRN